jgi:acyl-CoA thioesterase FadM
MNLIFRVLYVFILSLFRPKLRLPEEETHLDLMVLPNDLDSNFHMNNGRYLTIMDLGRLDMILRSGFLKVMRQEKAVPILASAAIRYRLSLDPWMSYRLSSKIIWWDEKWLYIEQRFIINKGDKAGAVAAIALVKGNFYSRRDKAVIPTTQIIQSIHPEPLSIPECPTHLKKWIETDQEMRNLTKL